MPQSDFPCTDILNLTNIQNQVQKKQKQDTKIAALVKRPCFEMLDAKYRDEIIDKF